MGIPDAHRKSIGIVAERKHGGTRGHGKQKFMSKRYANIHTHTISNPCTKPGHRLTLGYKYFAISDLRIVYKSVLA
jgi:hypothetical protein